VPESKQRCVQRHQTKHGARAGRMGVLPSACSSVVAGPGESRRGPRCRHGVSGRHPIQWTQVERHRWRGSGLFHRRNNRVSPGFQYGRRAEKGTRYLKKTVRVQNVSWKWKGYLVHWRNRLRGSADPVRGKPRRSGRGLVRRVSGDGGGDGFDGNLPHTSGWFCTSRTDGSADGRRCVLQAFRRSGRLAGPGSWR